MSTRRVAACVAASALVLGAVAAGATPASAAPAPIGPGLFGLHVGNPVDNWPTVPFGTIRIWDSGVHWAALQPTPTTWDFTKLDAQVERAIAGKKDIVMVLGITPRWASKRPNEAGNYGVGTAAEPKDIRTWTAYVRKLAIRYKGKINKWELYNEPNAVLNFSGKPIDMVRMAQQAWGQLKSVSRSNVVISPGIVTRTLNSPKWLDEYLRLGGGRYANVIAAHFYVKAKERPEDTIRYLAVVRKILKDRRLSHLPLWNTESSYGRYNPTDRATHEVYAGSTSMAYVARTYVLMASGGVARSYWYGWDHRNYTGLYLTTNGSTAGPAGKAYGVTYGWLVGKQMLGCTRIASGALAGGFSCALRRGGTQIRILWHPDRTRPMRIPAGYRALHRLDGSKQSVRTGTVFNVGPTPVYITTAP